MSENLRDGKGQIIKQKQIFHQVLALFSGVEN